MRHLWRKERFMKRRWLALVLSGAMVMTNISPLAASAESVFTEADEAVVEDVLLSEDEGTVDAEAEPDADADPVSVEEPVWEEYSADDLIDDLSADEGILFEEETEMSWQEVSDDVNAADDATDNHFQIDSDPYFPARIYALYGKDVTLTVNASCDQGSLTYEWSMYSGGERVKIEGETGSSLVLHADKSIPRVYMPLYLMNMATAEQKPSLLSCTAI